MSIALPELQVAGETNCGCVRGHNEDNFCCAAMPGYVLAAVADGVGGNSGGEIASYLACHRLLWQWKRFWTEYPHPEDPLLPRFLADALRNANSDIYRANLERRKRTPMGTTIAAAAFSPDMAITVHAGDSRIYCSRGRDFRQLTVDHTLRNKLAESGQLPENDNLTPKNIISRALGPLPEMALEIHTFFRAPQDRYLLCSDGLTNHWRDDELKAVLDAAATPREAAGNLIAGTLRRGATDNVTVVCVFSGASAMAES